MLTQDRLKEVLDYDLRLVIHLVNSARLALRHGWKPARYNGPQTIPIHHD